MSNSSSQRNVVEVLAEEFVERYRQGDRPPLTEYTRQYPDLAEEIEDLFPAMLLMENLKPVTEDGAAASPPLSAPPIEHLGDYRIIREVGRGGMGIVYEAEQVSLGRHVALKVLPRELLSNPKHRSRFEREAKAAAKLHHTNIVPVFGVGEEHGMGYYVMQFIQGLALDEVLEELKKMRSSDGNASGSSQIGELRVSRRDVSAVEVARSLMTGSLAELNAETVQVEGDDRPSSGFDETIVKQIGDDVNSESLATGSTASGRLSDTFSLSGSSANLLGGTRNTAQPNRGSYWQSVAQIGAQVAEALAYAHGQGVLHRDINPANLVLDMRGTVWVTDFGLAKLDDDRGLTQTGDILGTLRYMAPETFKGDADARSELYSLGLTLYELLALRPAFQQTSRNMLVDQVLQAQIEPLSKINREIPSDLQTIVHKAIEREPGDRYQTAQEFADDLQRFLDDEPIKARRISLVERLGRWSRRNKTLAASLASVAVLITLIALGSTIAAGYFQLLNQRLSLTVTELTSAQGRLEEARETAEQKSELAMKAQERESELRQLSEQRERAIQSTLYAAEMNIAGQAAEELTGIRRVSQITNNWQGNRGGRDLRGWEWYYLVSLCHADQRTLPYHSNAVAWNPDGTLFASAGVQGQLQIWTADQALMVKSFDADVGNVNDISWSADGVRLAVAFDRGSVTVFDASSGQVIKSIKGLGEAFSAKWSPDNSKLATVISDGKLAATLDIWDSESWERVASIVNRNENHCAWSPDSQKVATCDGIYDASSGENLADLSHKGLGAGVDWSPTGSRIAFTGGNDLVVVSATSGEIQQRLKGHTQNLRSVNWSPDGNLLVSAGDDNTIRVWNVTEGSQEAIYRGHTNWVMDAKFSPTGRQIASASLEIKLWDVGAHAQPFVIENTGTIADIVWNDAGTRVATGGGSGVNLWDVVEGRRIAGIDAEQAAVWSQFSSVMDWHSETKTIAIVREQTLRDRTCELIAFDSDTLKERFRYGDFATQSRSVAISPDGSRISVCGWSRIGGSERSLVILLDAATGDAIWQTVLPSDVGGSMRWSPDGSRIAMAGWQSLAVLRSDTGEVQTPATEIAAVQWINSINWNSSGDRLALGGSDGTVRIVDVTGNEIHRLLEHTAAVTSVAWSPDGSRLATSGIDRTVRIWDPATGTQLLALKGHRENVTALAWSPDGMQLASGDIGGELRIWDAFIGYVRAGSPAILARVQKVLEENPDDIAALELSALIHGRQGDLEALEQDRRRLLQVLERRFRENPVNAPAAEELAGALLEFRKKVAWNTVEPISGRSQYGAALHMLDDRSLIASGNNVAGDTYTVQATCNVGQLAAVRLQVLPDASLPNNGPGRHASGNFQLASLRLYRQGIDGSPPEELRFSSAVASYAYQANDANVAGVIDESLDTVWHVWGKFGQEHHADFVLESPCEIRPGDVLTFELGHVERIAVNLGHFRLLVRESGDGAIRELLDNAMAQEGLVGVEKLAAAYILTGDPQRAKEVLEANESEAMPEGLQTLLLAIAEQGLGNREAAQKLHAQWRGSLGDQMLTNGILPLMRVTLIEIENFTPQAASSYVVQLQSLAELSRLSGIIAEQPDSTVALWNRATIYRQMGNWREAAQDLVRLVDVTSNRLHYTSAAACLLLADDVDGYQALCRRMVDQFGDNQEADIADSTCKVCLLRPGSVPVEELPVDALAQGLPDSQWKGYHTWFTASLALVAYRSGEYQQALDLASQLGTTANQVNALALAVRAMAHHRLGNAAQARDMLQQLDGIVPAELRTLGTESHERSVPSSARPVDHDWLIAEILRREAATLIEREK